MKVICTALLLLVLIAPGEINAQISSAELQAAVEAGIDPYFVESRDTVSRYGPGCITRDVLQDRNGDYWLATWHGIIKYSGRRFTNYTLKDGLIHFHVVSCYEDKKGNLWFGTARGGLYRYDGRSFKLFTVKDGLVDNSVTCFAEDQQGNIWFGTENGVSRYDGRRFTNFTTKDGLRSNNIHSMIVDRTGRLWFGSQDSRYLANDGGITCYDGKSIKGFESAGELPHKSIVSLFEDKAGNIWIGTFSGLIKYDGKAFNLITDLPAYLAYYIIEDKKGDIWLTSSRPSTVYENMAAQSLFRYDGKTFTRVLEKNRPGDNQVFGKIADRNGNIWFGTMKGVCRYDGQDFHYFNRGY